MISSGSTLLFGAIPSQLKPSASEKRSLAEFMHSLCRRACDSRPFVCLIADDAHLRKLNFDFLAHDYPTDVLSFPAWGVTDELGEIAISIERVAIQAAEFGHSNLDEVRILMLHGVLHLNGFDHEKDNGKMSRTEKRWRSEFGLPETLIARGNRRKGAA
jgi:probable rRNA maturation factor